MAYIIHISYKIQHYVMSVVDKPSLILYQ